MVLIRTNKDKIVELITATLHKYLSETQIAKNRSTFENICAKINQSLKGVSDRLEAKIISLENENTKLRERLNDYEQYTRREEEEGNADSTTKDTLDKMEIDTESYIDRCYRVARELEKDVNNAKGAPKKNVNRRCIIVKFTPYYKRNDGSKNKKLLKGLGISISEGIASQNYELFKKAKLKYGPRRVYCLGAPNANGARCIIRSIDNIGNLPETSERE